MWEFDRTASHLTLDFANTVSGRTTPAPIDRLADYAHFIEFARQTQIATEVQAKSLLARAKKHPIEAERTHARIQALRDATHNVFASIAAATKPAPEDVRTLSDHIRRLELDVDLAYNYLADEDGLDAPLGPIIRGAVELIDPSMRERVGMCGRDTCRFLFLDTTKNRTRRWCEMKSCGNREKARRFREN